VLQHQGVAGDDVEGLLLLARQVQRPSGRGVRRAYVRLERHATAEALLDFAPHLVASRSPLQTALGLWGDGAVALDGVVRVARSLCERGGLPRRWASSAGPLPARDPERGRWRAGA